MAGSLNALLWQAWREGAVERVSNCEQASIKLQRMSLSQQYMSCTLPSTCLLRSGLIQVHLAATVAAWSDITKVGLLLPILLLLRGSDALASSMTICGSTQLTSLLTCLAAMLFVDTALCLNSILCLGPAAWLYSTSALGTATRNLYLYGLTASLEQAISLLCTYTHEAHCQLPCQAILITAAAHKRLQHLACTSPAFIMHCSLKTYNVTASQ